MTQPRKDQIKSVNTRYTALPFSDSAGSSSKLLASGAYSPYLVTDVLGGAESNAPASVTGTVQSAFTILAGDALFVSLDGAPPVLVTFAGTDTTTSRVANRINTTTSSSIASNDGGYLKIQSASVGEDASIALTESVPGTLSKFGIVSGTYYGVPALTRGVLTSPSGFAPLATEDGRQLVTDGGDLRVLSVVSTFRAYTSYVPGGFPLFAETTAEGTSLRLTYGAFLPTRPSATTFNSTFSLLDGTDSFTIELDPGFSFSVTFPSAPYTRDQVIDRVNSQFATALSISTGARVVGSVSSPFGFTGTLQISVDGGAPVSASLTTAEVTTAQMATAIQSQVPGLTAAALTTDYGSFIQLTSSNTNGRTSSIRIYAADTNTLLKLGLRAGTYRGAFLADSYGPDEIVIKSPSRGSANSLVISGLSPTLARMGLSAATHTGSDTAAFEEVPLPRLAADDGSIDSYTVQSLCPEVLEFGDVDPTADSSIEKFAASSAGGNRKFTDEYFINHVGELPDGISANPGRGLTDFGKVPVVGPEGSVPAEQLRVAFDHSDAVFKQAVRRSSTGAVQALAANVFESPSVSGGNPITIVSPGMTMDVDPDTQLGSGAAALQVRFFRNGTPITPFKFKAGTFGGSGYDAYLELTSDDPIYSLGSALKLADINTKASGDAASGKCYVELSSATDPNLRVGETDIQSTVGQAQLPGYNILRAINGRHRLTVGDGTNSFGDFSGASAIQSAIDFAVAAGLGAVHIMVKHGNYSMDSTGTLNLTQGTLYSVFLEGELAEYDQLSIISTTLSSAVFSSTHSSSYIQFKNLEIRNNGATPSALISMAGSLFEAENCLFSNSHVTLTNMTDVVFRKCNFSGIAAASMAGISSVVCTWSSTRTPTIDFIDCSISGSNVSTGAAAFLRLAVTGSPTVTLERVRFQGCDCTLTKGVVSGNAITSPGGLIDVSPGTSNAYGSNGLRIGSFEVVDCDMSAGVFGSGTHKSFIVLCPTGQMGSGTWVFDTDPAIRIENVLIDGGTWSVSGGDPVLSSVAIGGIGIGTSNTPGTDNWSAAFGRLTFKNVTMSMGTAVNGEEPTCFQPFTSNYTDPSDAGVGGNIMLAGFDIRVEDINIEDMIAGSGEPDILLAPYKILKVDGIIMKDFDGDTTLSEPPARVYIRPIFGENIIDVRRIFLDGSGITEEFASEALIYCTSNGASGTGSADNGIWFRDIVITEFGKDGLYDGIFLDGDNDDGIVNLSGLGLRNILIENCYIKGMSRGGVRVAALADSIDGVVIRGCNIVNCDFNGVYVAAEGFRDRILIDGNNVISCGQNDIIDSSGIKCHVENWLGGVFIVNNSATFCNASNTDIQINCYKSGSSAGFLDSTQAIIKNNYCISNADVGTINSRKSTATSYSGTVAVASAYTQGIETNYDLAGPSYVFTVGGRMIHNLAKLSSTATVE